MTRLDITFQTLAASSNEAAISVLGVALGDPDARVRLLATAALADRRELRCGELLLGHWDQMDECQKQALREHPGPLPRIINDSLARGDHHLPNAIQAATALHRFEMVPKLVDLAETHISHTIRKSATQSVGRLADLMGAQARGGRDPGSIRIDALARLARSVEQLPLHRNRDLVDAFLLASTSRDGKLLQMLDTESPQSRVLVSRFRNSSSDSIANLLASFLRRPKLQPEIANLICDRNDASFRRELLDQVGPDPTTGVLHHLRLLGPIGCMDDNPTAAAALSPDAHAALLHVLSQTTQSPKKLLVLAVAGIHRGEATTTQAATTVLASLPKLDHTYWLNAAIELAEDFDHRITLSADAMLLGDLVDLLSHGDANVVRAVQRVLTPLHAKSIMPRLSGLDASSRQRLGAVLMMIDPSAIDLVRDRLRHPVLKQRLDAIAAAESLGIVDLLADAFSHVVRNDHQEARRRAAEAMALASSSETLALLSEMMQMPDSSARDEAVRAYESRV